ncbi:MAG: hypothetical protein J0H22_16605 [Actinobacteria bacterium]|nr:hypothetical protein [Actinomycetota bacterium]
MAHDEEVFAERQRLEARAAAHNNGTAKLTMDLEHNSRARTKLAAAWEDAVEPFGYRVKSAMEKRMSKRGARSAGVHLDPSDMHFGFSDSNDLFSLIEAEHEALVAYAAGGETNPTAKVDSDFRELPPIAVVRETPDAFLADVNRILETHDIAVRLTATSKLVPVTSFALHDAVTAPTLHLLHGHHKFASTEAAYLKALQEIRNGDAGDAITDAATALQAALTTLGCAGTNLGALISSARQRGLMRGNDTPLAEAITGTARWVAAQRNEGEAHIADADASLGDAWMVVHVVGALIIRLVGVAQAK